MSKGLNRMVRQQTKFTEVGLLSAKVQVHMVQVPHLAFMGCTKPQCKHHHGIPWEKIPRDHIWHGQFELEQTWQNRNLSRGLVAILTKLYLIKGSICKMNLTIELSG